MITASAIYLKGEGMSKDKHNEIISNNTYSSNPKNTVPVFGPDKKRLKNTKVSKAKKWIKQGKAKQVKDKFRPEEFAIQLFNRKDKSSCSQSGWKSCYAYIVK